MRLYDLHLAFWYSVWNEATQMLYGQVMDKEVMSQKSIL